MNCFKQVGNLALTLACVGFVIPQSRLAAEPKQNLPTTDVVNPIAVSAPAVYDVVLSPNGILQGKVVDPQGTSLAGIPVGLFHNGREVAVSMTDANGHFSVIGLRGGLYLIRAGYGTAVYRLWAPNTAPPVAREVAMVVSDRQIARGQLASSPFWSFAANPWVIAGAIAAAIAIPVVVAANKAPSS